MPIYSYQCSACGQVFDAHSSVEERDKPRSCLMCPGYTMHRHFVPTANIFVHAHFRVLQSDVLPAKEDTAAWEARSSNSQYRPSEAKRESLSEHMTREMAQMGDTFWKPQSG